uniref:Uncharacterized protein n=1 Tax=Sphaerodactylus townsendi TaxID=933632 RepID=A0ACB8FC07_9SAUR
MSPQPILFMVKCLFALLEIPHPSLSVHSCLRGKKRKILNPSCARRGKKNVPQIDGMFLYSKDADQQADKSFWTRKVSYHGMIWILRNAGSQTTTSNRCPHVILCWRGYLNDLLFFALGTKIAWGLQQKHSQRYR